MLWLSKLKKIGFYPEAFEKGYRESLKEGYREGFREILESAIQKGRLQAKIEMVSKLQQRGFALSEIAELLELEIETIELTSQQ